MGHGEDSGVAVEAFEVLPHRLVPVDDDVWMRWPIVGLRSCLHVDAVKHQPDSSHHGIELSPLGLRLLLQHVELGFGLLTVFCMHQKDLSNKEVTSVITPTMNY